MTVLCIISVLLAILSLIICVLALRAIYRQCRQKSNPSLIAQGVLLVLLNMICCAGVVVNLIKVFQ